MPNKKKDKITSPLVYHSYFRDKILPVLLIPALTAGFVLIALYFTVGTLSLRVSALENDRVRKDVLVEQLTPMKQDIADIKDDVKSIREDFNTYIINKK